MPTLKIDRPGQFSLTSYWKCKKKGLAELGKKAGSSQYKIASTPSTASTSISFSYSLPSGKKITNATLWAKFSSPSGGISIITANGNAFSKVDGARKGAKIDIASTAGSVTIAIKFRGNGKIYEDTNTHSGVLWISEVSLWIDYEDAPVSNPSSQQTRNTSVFSVPPQSVCIYDTADKSVYMFDGVCKIGHALSSDIQEEPDKPKDYVNNAKNQPDKLTLDVVMSDVYTGGGAIVSKGGNYSDSQQEALSNAGKFLLPRDNGDGVTRSESAFKTLHWLKESRRKLCVITPQYVYVDMIIASVSVNQEDTTPFGWEGQVVLQAAFPAKKKAKAKTKSDSKDGPEKPSVSTLKDTINRLKNENDR